MSSTQGPSNSFGARSEFVVNGVGYEIFRLDAIENSNRLPFSLKVLLENVLRNENGLNVTTQDVEALANWDAKAEPSQEIQFSPARVVLQDFTGVPAIVDLAAMREAMTTLGGDPAKINPLVPAELVIDHSVIADVFGVADALEQNIALEFERNHERYQFLRWGQSAFDTLKVVPPGTGIVHQVNIEHLARVVFDQIGDNGVRQAYPDTLVGTDSHTTMVNGLGVLGWGVGGIEAEAAMLGQPVSMLVPRVVGFKLEGQMPEGTTATDLVLTITEMLRKHGVVGKLVEFYGPGVASVPLANRATIGNMSPEYGSTAATFPIDEETLRYMRFTGREEAHVALVEAYAKEQGLWHDPSTEAEYSETLSLDLSTIEPSIAGPKRPQDRVALTNAKQSFATAVKDYAPNGDAKAAVALKDGAEFQLGNGAVVIASITSCTNTSNPSVMLGAALLAKKAVERGLSRKPWVKTTLAPGSKVVMDYYDRAGLTPFLNQLGFNLVGYGCTTCIGNSGPLIPEVSQAIQDNDLAAVSVLSGNRNFEGRINPDVKMNYLASPPLVVAYALAGTMEIDFVTEPIGVDNDGKDVFLADIWPSPQEIQSVMDDALRTEMFSDKYSSVFDGDQMWQELPTPTGDTFAWKDDSTYIRKPTFFTGTADTPSPVVDIAGARVLAKLGDSVTTDHISPAGSIAPNSPAGDYLESHGVARPAFNSYGSRRGNHEVMIRGTFANIRLRNQLVPGVEGGFTRDFTRAGEQTTIFEAAENYREQNVPLVILAGKEYGSGSSRDWAAKGTFLLGVRAVIAESYERIHRSNLIGMGVLPLEYPAGENAESLGLTGEEIFSFSGIVAMNNGPVPKTVLVTAQREDGTSTTFDARVRIDTPGEAEYYRHGGILQYVLRSLKES